MMGNCEKMVHISSNYINEIWPQNNQIHDQNLMASTNMAMEQPTPEQGLKCPRCDSSNTKFCYYNNYSLSQPRHFCKACKRYWTRGGTLRNVPVGGGCRKNKRVKRPASSAVDSSPSCNSSAPMATANPNSQPQVNHINPNLFYHDNPNLSFLRFNSRVDNEYDHLQPQMNALGFSSGQIMASDVTSKALLSSYHLPIFGSSSASTASASPTMASLLQQQKFTRAGNSFLGFPPYENMQMQGSNNGVMSMEECQNGLNQIGSSDPNSLFWNANGVGSWLDPANVGSSVPSLI